MPETTVGWLLDVGLPRVTSNGHDLDILHTDDLTRRPGHAGLTEAMLLNRALVTLDTGFRGAWHIPIPHHGLIILEESPTSGEEIVRNLTHLLFCLHHRGCDGNVFGHRYVIRADSTILHILPNGSEEEMETWKQPHVLVHSSVI